MVALRILMPQLFVYVFIFVNKCIIRTILSNLKIIFKIGLLFI